MQSSIIAINNRKSFCNIVTTSDDTKQDVLHLDILLSWYHFCTTFYLNIKLFFEQDTNCRQKGRREVLRETEEQERKKCEKQELSISPWSMLLLSPD